jgi:predicted nucleic acid-binding protein
VKVVVADTGAIISLVHVGQLGLIENIFGDYFIAEAVWQELQVYDNPGFDRSVLKDIEKRVIKIKSTNHLSMVMDFGESESVILYDELKADFLLIDDNKARAIAESLNVKCIGSIGLLMQAKLNGSTVELRPIFQKWISLGRFFSKKLLNTVLTEIGENTLGDG